MTPPVEERTRAAMDAITGLVENAPPLRLPPPPEAGGAAAAARRRRRVPWPRRRWNMRDIWSIWGLRSVRGSWGSRLAPVAAAATVLAIAIALVAVRAMPHARTAPSAPGISPAGAPVSFPAYYLTFSQPRGATVPVGLVLADTLTGKKLATLPPPHGLSFAGITGAADDRTFVADAHWQPWGVPGSYGRSRTWYLIRVVGTGSQVSLTMTTLPIKPTPVGTEINSIALSPDGTMLAVASQPITANSKVAQVVGVYSVATGAVLHSWSSAPGEIPPIEGGGGEGGDDNASLAWVGNHALVYYGAVEEKPGVWSAGVMELDLSRPDGGISASSRLAGSLPLAGFSTSSPFGCDPVSRSDIVITGDGKSFVCGGYGVSSAPLPKLYCRKQPTLNTVAFAGFSLTGSKPATFLSGYRTGCYGYNVTGYAVWANATGSAVIGYMIFGGKNSGMFGVFSKGSFRPLPYPVPGNSYQYQAGSLLYQVAW